jgi:hypothetical protein
MSKPGIIYGDLACRYSITCQNYVWYLDNTGLGFGSILLSIEGKAEALTAINQINARREEMGLAPIAARRQRR